MNWNRIEGNWQQLKPHVLEQWGKFSEEDLTSIAGKREQLMGRIQQSYGVPPDEAEKQIRDFETRCKKEHWVQ